MTDWKLAVKNARHYLAIGQNRIDLGDGCVTSFYPWGLVTDCEPGGIHRLDISTDIHFVAKHKSGLEFHWSLDIEPEAPNGSGSYHIDVDSVRQIIPLLPVHAVEKLRAYFAAYAKAVREWGDEYKRIAEQQFSTADALEKLEVMSAPSGSAGKDRR